MDHKKQLNHLASKIEYWKKRKGKQSDDHWNRAFFLRLLSASFGALVTIFLGIRINSPDDQLMKNLALVAGALIAVVNVLEAFSKDRAQWMGRQITLLKLFNLGDKIEFLQAGLGEGGIVSKARVDKLFDEYSEIWQSAARDWERLLKEEKKEGQGEGAGLPDG